MRTIRRSCSPNSWIMRNAGDSNGDSDSLHTTHTQIPSILAVSPRKVARAPRGGELDLIAAGAAPAILERPRRHNPEAVWTGAMAPRWHSLTVPAAAR